MYIFPYCIHILHVFFHRVGVVETQIACAAKLLGHTEVHAYGLGMPYVQISVRFRRETCIQASAILTIFQVVGHYLLNKVESFLLCIVLFVYFYHDKTGTKFCRQS